MIERPVIERPVADDPVVRCGPVVRTHAEVRERSRHLAGALAERGVGPGDRYAIVLVNSVEFIEATLAAGSLGAVPVPVNWHWTGSDLRHLLTDSGARVAIVHADLVAGVEAAAPEGLEIIEVARTGSAPSGRHPDLESLIADSPAVTDTVAAPLGVIYTSGTTGTAKGILRDAVDASQSAEIGQRVLRTFAADPSMSTLVPAPMYHTAPNAHAVFAVALGMDLHIMERFDAEAFLALVAEQRIEHTQMVPTMFVRLLKLPAEVRDRYDVSSLRSVVHAAAPCPVDVKRAMIDWWGPIVSEYYGGSETGGVVWCSAEEWLAHPGTVGRPQGDSGVRILDPAGVEVATGAVGDVYLKPSASWPDFTYIGNDAKRREMERDGYLTVGDVGRVDADGYLYLSDRRNDMVISGGVNIYPAEIEACLIGLDGVADVAVFGIPDPDFGEALAAHVELIPAAAVTDDDVRAYVRTHLAGYKVPKVVVFEERLPREDSGKLFKRKLKAPYWEGARG